MTLSNFMTLSNIYCRDLIERLLVSSLPSIVSRGLAAGSDKHNALSAVPQSGLVFRL